MSTDLLVAARGLDPAVLAGAVPPACRCPVDVPAQVAITGGEVVLGAPEWTPRVPAVHLLPSLSVLGDGETSVRLEISARIAGEWTPWTAGASLGAEPFPPLPGCAALTCDIDVFAAVRPAQAVRLRARLRGAGTARAADGPWMLALSAWSGTLDIASGGGPGARLVVPARSQVADGGTVAMHICSPTSVAMVLDYWRAPVETLALAAEIYQPGLDRYGVWPAAIRAAAHHGVAGYLLRFPDWPSAAWCVEHGMPIVASVRYAAGELTDAAVPQTTGHLLVITGYEGEVVLVNDPAAPTAATVARRYRLDEVVRIWLGRAGVGYVLFKP